MTIKHDIRALTVGARVARCCKQTCSVRVLSVHNRVINLIAGNELLALSIPQAGGSSRFLCLNRLPEVVSGEEVHLTPSALLIGETAVSLEKVPLWKAPFSGSIHAELSYEHREAFLNTVQMLAVLPGIPFEGPLVPESVPNLLGLGPGLTPAGDDILLGYLALDNHLGKDRVWTERMHQAVRDNLSRTTLLSSQLLKNAIEGDYHETVQRVLAVLFGQSRENLVSAVRRLATVGASSGASTIYGMKLALERVMTQEKQGFSFQRKTMHRTTKCKHEKDYIKTAAECGCFL